MSRIVISLIVLFSFIDLPATELVEMVATGRQHYATVIAARDAAVSRLERRMTEDGAKTEPLDLVLIEENHLKHQPMRLFIAYRGGRFYGDRALLLNWNHGRHDVDASGLRLDGDRLSGVIRVTLNPDQWVPPDRRPRHQEHHIDAVIADGQIRGTYRYTGHLGPDKDHLAGTVTTVSTDLTVNEPGGGESISPDADGLIRLAELTVSAYRQLRAAALAWRNYPISYRFYLQRSRVPVPRWQAGNSAHQNEAARVVARLAALAEAYDPQTAAQYSVGSCHPDDERFGPFFHITALDQDETGVVELPGDIGTEGPQRWQYIERWQITGPFPAPLRLDRLHPQLPETVPTRHAVYETRTEDFPGADYVHPDWLSEGEKDQAYNSYRAGDFLERMLERGKPETAMVHTVERQTRTGRYEHAVAPPRWSVVGTKVPVYGATKTFYYARTTIESSRAQELWAEARCRDAGQLWVNDQLVWHSTPDLSGSNRPQYAIFKLSLRAGRNDLVVRCRNDDTQTSVRVLLCTRGRPRVESGIDLGFDQPEAVAFDFRGNGSGTWPAPSEGRPPLAWNLEDGTNVRWSRNLPAWSNAYPIIVADRIYTNCEPHWLYCLDKMSGEVLWKRASSLAEFMAPEDRETAASAYELLATANQQGERQGELGELKDAKAEIDLRLRDEEDSLAEEELEGLRERSQQLADEIDKLSIKRHPGMRVLRKYGASASTWHDFTGFTMATPVTDGTWIWVKYATGVVACYDLDGERRWMIDTKLAGRIPGVSSPVLIGDRLIVEGGIKKRLRAAGKTEADLRAETGAVANQDHHFVVALDAATGEELWHRPVKCGIGGYGTPSGPRAMRLYAEGEPVDVIMTQRYVLRASDGAIFVDSINVGTTYTSMAFDGLVISDGPITSYWAESPDQVGQRLLVGNDGNYGSNGCVLAADGRLYGNPDANMRAGRAHIPWLSMVVTEARSGKTVVVKKPVMEDTGQDYVPAAACGDFVYLTGRNGEVVTVHTGPVPMTIGRSRLDGGTYTGPIFDDDRMYVRTRRSLTCFQTTTEEGRDYEYRQSVQEMFDSCVRLPLIPKAEPVPTIPPAGDFIPGDGVPVAKAYEQLGPPRWLVLGPFTPSDEQVDHLEPLGGSAAARPEPGTAIGDQQFRPLDPAVVSASAGLQKDLYNKDYYSSRSTIDLTALTAGKGKAVFYFYSVVEVTKSSVYTYTAKGQDNRTWLAGEELEDNGRVRLQAGYYPLLIRAKIGRIPPFARGRSIQIAPHFIRVDDPVDALVAWCEEVAPYEERLQEVMQRMEGNKWTFAARRYLEKLAECRE